MPAEKAPHGLERLTGAFANIVIMLGALAAGAFFFKKSLGSKSPERKKHAQQR